MRFIFAALLAVFAAAATAQDFVRSAPLGTSQVTGSLVGDVSNAAGSAAVSFDSNTDTLSWQIVFDGLTGPISVAHIHGPAPLGTDAGVLIDLVANSGGNTSPMVGSVVVDGATASAIRDGLSYINLHTDQNPAGEIRGQLMPLADFSSSAAIDVTQVVPAGGSLASGLAIGSGGVDYNAASQELSWDIYYSGLSGPLTVAHIHGAATAEQTAGVLVDLLAGGATNDGSHIVGTAVVDSATASFIRDGFSYINLHTDANPAGEIRGQLLPQTDFRSIVALDALQATNNPSGAEAAIGGGGLTFNAQTGELSWTINYTNLTGPLQMAHVHAPAARGETAGVIIDLIANGTDDGSMLSGQTIVSDTAEIGFIRDGLSYVNLHTTANPAGEIRGQIERLANFTTVAAIDPLQAVNELSGDTDDAIGSAAVSFDESTNTLSWDVQYFNLTGAPTVAHIHGPAAVGQTAGVLIDLLANAVIEPGSIIGSVDNVDIATLGYLVASLGYVNIHTETNPMGEIRGQLEPLTDFASIAALDSDQATNNPINARAGIGGGGLVFDVDSGVLSWDIYYTNLTGPLSVAHIHGPAPRGQAAGVLIDLLANGTDDGSQLSGQAMISDPAIAGVIRNGLSYVNLHTAANPMGEIRGQIERLADFSRVAVIDPSQAVNPLAGDVAEAIGSAGISYEEDTNTLSWEVHYFNLTGAPTVAHIHGPAAVGETAGVLIDLLAGATSEPGVIIGSTDVVDVAALGYIVSSLGYVNIHTATNPAGEIRGQVLPITDRTLEANIDTAQVLNALNGDTSLAMGSGLLKISASDLSLSWDVRFSGLTGAVTVAHIHGPATPQLTAGVLIDLVIGTTASPLQGSAPVTPIVIADLLAGLTYINIHTALNPMGEIRGQVTTALFSDGFEG